MPIKNWISLWFNRTKLAGRLPLIFCMLIAASCGSLLVKTESMQVVKSPNDERQYQRLRLDNNLDVLLISDPATDKAAAALDLYIGSYQNPEQRQGLAHFLEHMLFLGTEQFPQPDSYQTFISEHGGSHNASTGLEHTNYFFDINAEHLTEALDRFAPFFTNPLFDASYVDRERNAVESEYQLKYKNDGRRQWDVFREIANSKHPISKFNVGNLGTLSDSTQSSVRDELIDFYNKYYSANLMTLVVLGKQPLHQLEKIVRERFSTIKDKRVVIDGYKARYVEPSQLPMQVNIKPLKDTRELGLLFELPKLNADWQSKPADYLAAMIGYEGQGSLLQALKAKGWADSLSAGAVLEDRSAGLFAIDIGLTPAGLKAREQVLIELFAWIDLIAREGIEEWRHNEYAAMGEIAFRFAEKQDPASYVTTVARNMHQYKNAEILRAPYVAEQFNGTIIKTIISQLTPDNMLMFVTSPDAEVAANSQYYQTPYLSKSLDNKTVERIEDSASIFELSLAQANPFIPDDLAVIDGANYAKPSLYLNQSGLKVWHHQTSEFGSPKAKIVILLNTELSQSLAGLSSAKLYSAYISDQLNEKLYPAIMAGLGYSISATEKGISIVISGYSDKQQVLLQSIVSAMVKPQWDWQRFELIKQQLIREKNNAKRDYPFRQAISSFYAIVQGRWTPVDQAEAMQTISFAQIQKFSSQLTSSFDAKLLITGNHSSESVDGVIRQLDSMRFADMSLTTKVAKLQQTDISHAIAVEHSDSVLIQYIQADNESIKERAVVGLLSQMMSAPFYNQLRTERQLGYVVSAFAMPINRVAGFAMLVQSPVATVKSLKAEFKQFNRAFSQQVENLTNEELEKHKRALLVNLEKSPDNLSELKARHLQSISLGYHSFDFHQQLGQAISVATVDEIKAAYQRLVVIKPRRLWVYANDNVAVNSTADNRLSVDQHYMFPY